MARFLSRVNWVKSLWSPREKKVTWFLKIPKMFYNNLLSLTLFIYQTFGCREKPNEMSTFQGCGQAVAEDSRETREHSGLHARRTGPGHALYSLAVWSRKLLTSSDSRSLSENWVKRILRSILFLPALSTLQAKMKRHTPDV